MTPSWAESAPLAPPVELVPATAWTWRNAGFAAAAIGVSVARGIFGLVVVLPAGLLPLWWFPLVFYIPMSLLILPGQLLVSRLLPPDPSILEVSPEGVHVGLGLDLERWYRWDQIRLVGNRLAVPPNWHRPIVGYALRPEQASRLVRLSPPAS